ncbi:type VI secretion system baseplate subunit TssG [Pseudoduganella lutea]|uniref:Type VI secretion system baseplate subunit TssG n=1 Tax=Pseudoduganella lutea TaxID=321985 RepID=A0A4P6KWB8_9BURK|nr:type VI secretion system baseplate subunit TssG [Pseudoduganella lutea]
MQTPQRQREPGLIGQLFAEPWRFGFLPAVTQVLRWFARRGVPADEALVKSLRFENSMSLAFPASEIEAIRTEDQPDGPCVVMTPTCIGLLGTAGTLPMHDTDRFARAAATETGTRAFLDFLSTRMVGLFWKSWAMNRQEVMADTQGRDAWRARLQALAGKEESGLDTEAWYAGLLRVRPVSAATLECILAGELGLPVRVDSMVGCWQVVNPAQRTILGVTKPKLGTSTMVGRRLWRVDHRLRIVIGPLKRAQYDWLLPRGEGARLLSRLVATVMAQALLEYEVCLLPGPECIRPLVLSAKPGKQLRLGWDTSCRTRPAAPASARSATCSNQNSTETIHDPITAIGRVARPPAADGPPAALPFPERRRARRHARGQHAACRGRAVARFSLRSGTAVGRRVDPAQIHGRQDDDGLAGPRQRHRALLQRLCHRVPFPENRWWLRVLPRGARTLAGIREAARGLRVFPGQQRAGNDRKDLCPLQGA